MCKPNADSFAKDRSQRARGLKPIFKCCFFLFLQRGVVLMHGASNLFRARQSLPVTFNSNKFCPKETRVHRRQLRDKSTLSQRKDCANAKSHKSACATFNWCLHAWRCEFRGFEASARGFSTSASNAHWPKHESMYLLVEVNFQHKNLSYEFKVMGENTQHHPPKQQVSSWCRTDFVQGQTQIESNRVETADAGTTSFCCGADWWRQPTGHGVSAGGGAARTVCSAPFTNPQSLARTPTVCVQSAIVRLDVPRAMPTETFDSETKLRLIHFQ